jgi:8-oxo-dGTP diphosphatase
VIPRLGESARRDIRYRLRPGAYAILARSGEVLLTHQAAPTPEYQLPGGGIDPGESPIASLHREVMEETGWRIGPVRRLGAYRRFTYMPEYDLWAEKLCHIYLARPALRRGDPTEAGHTAIWTPIATAVGLVASAGDRKFLSDLVRRMI